jgi:hypothetical protein
MKKEMRSALDVYQDLVETLNGDQQKVNEYIDNRLNSIKETDSEWGKYMMTNFWNQVRNCSLTTQN